MASVKANTYASRHIMAYEAARSAVFVIVAGILASCRSEPALLRHLEELRLIDGIEQRVLESVEAEKSAVLAITDAESVEYARQSRQSAGEIDRLQLRLAELIHEDARAGEVEKLAAFAATWSDLKQIDARLLDLAVANTNLKATRLSLDEGSRALDRFIVAIDALDRTSKDIAAIRSLANAAVAATRIQALLFAHIPERSDAEMTALEDRMHALAATVDEALRAADGGGGTADARAAWTDYQRIMVEVIRLSRLNTNVISFDVSVHEKRAATRACLDALGALRSAVEAGPTPTR